VFVSKNWRLIGGGYVWGTESGLISRIYKVKIETIYFGRKIKVIIKISDNGEEREREREN